MTIYPIDKLEPTTAYDRATLKRFLEENPLQKVQEWLLNAYGEDHFGKPVESEHTPILKTGHEGWLPHQIKAFGQGQKFRAKLMDSELLDYIDHAYAVALQGGTNVRSYDEIFGETAEQTKAAEAPKKKPAKKRKTKSAAKEQTSLIATDHTASPPDATIEVSQPTAQTDLMKMLAQLGQEVQTGFKRMDSRCDVLESSIAENRQAIEQCGSEVKAALTYLSDPFNIPGMSAYKTQLTNSLAYLGGITGGQSAEDVVFGIWATEPATQDVVSVEPATEPASPDDNQEPDEVPLFTEGDEVSLPIDELLQGDRLILSRLLKGCQVSTVKELSERCTQQRAFRNRALKMLADNGVEIKSADKIGELLAWISAASEG